jgi:general secretion pathway protein N
MARPAQARGPRAGSKPPSSWAVGGAVVGICAATVLFAPARWVARAVEQATRGHVVLSEPLGTVWNGSAQLLLTGGAGSTDAVALPRRVRWTLRPGMTAAAGTLLAECCMAQPLPLQLHWRIGGATLRLGDGSMRWPAALLAGLGTPWNTLQLDGDLQLSTRGLSVEWAERRLLLSGQADLVAQNMSSRLSTLRPMGSYRINLRGGATPTLRLDTIDGSLRLSGSGQWVGRRLRFNGEATAAPEREAALSNLLNIIGRRNGPRSIITIG